MTTAPSFVPISVKIDNSPGINFIVFCSLFFGVLSLSASFYAVASSRSPFGSSSSFPFCAATSKFVPWISILRHDGQGLFHQSFCLLSCNLGKRTTNSWFQFLNCFSLHIFRSTLLTVDNFVSSA